MNILGITAILVKWLTALEYVQFVLKYVTKTMISLMPNTDRSFVIVERKKTAAAL